VPIEIILPKVDMDMSHARLVQWHATEGAQVTRGQVLFEIETDKSTMEIEAEAGGTLGFVSGEPGSDIEIGRTIGWLFQPGEDVSVDPGGPGGGIITAGVPGAPDTAGATDATSVADTPDTARAEAGTEYRATPMARRVARERGVALGNVSGSGPRGRIVAADVGSEVEVDVGVGVPAEAPRAAGRPDRTAAVSLRDGIAWRRWGAEDGVPCVLLHGFGGDATAWAGLAARLVRHGRHVIAPDLPGHGLSEIGAPGPDALGDALGALRDILPANRACHLVAHSMGALPALQLARSLDLASLSLLAPIGMGANIDRDFLTGMAEPVSRAAMQHQLRKLGDRPLPMSEAALDALHAALAEGRLVALARALAGPAGQAVDIVPALAELAGRVPCRVVIGHLDRILDWRDAHRLGARVAVHHLPLAGHMPHWDAPAEVCDVLIGTG